MEIINGLHNLREEHRGCVLTIGNFDGVHLGHQALLDQLAERAKKWNVPSALMTFEPQPREFFAGSQLPARLTRFREKVHLLRRTALDRLICLPFNKKTAAMPAAWFADDLMHRLLGVRHVAIGDDFRFGKGREGDFELLAAAGRQHGYDVSSLPTMMQGDQRISSTLIRQLLGEGAFEAAADLLGHEYFIMGRVVYGRQLGRQLDAPTANVRLQRYRAALEGVYAVVVEGVGDRVRHGVANIGIRPTVDGKEPLLEVHLFDFSGNIYGQLIKVTFKSKLRDEQRFESIDALKAQIDCDIHSAKDWFQAQ